MDKLHDDVTMYLRRCDDVSRSCVTVAAVFPICGVYVSRRRCAVMRSVLNVGLRCTMSIRMQYGISDRASVRRSA
jgi:hypothetical protein